MESLFDQLNENQRVAVEYIDGPQLVIAGAGSGKTRVLTYKIAYLLTKGMKPWNILALTFTNKAANEMKQRIGTLVGNELAHSLYMGTFHSVFSRILRIEAERIGFNSSFTIYDESDSRSLLKSIMKEMGLDDKKYKPAAVHNRISMAKNHLVSPEQYAASHDALQHDSYAQMPALSKVYATYQQRCRSANAMDFDDLLVYTYLLFRDNPDVREKYAERFQYVLVDEYQDTNYAQQCIVLQLTKGHQKVCVVGDDAQSIYGFRGANIDNILGFQQTFPSTRLFKLEQNYRSTQRIVQAANSLIRKNSRQIHKDVYSHNDEGEKLILKQAYSDKEEAAIVCKDIRRIKRQDDCQYSDFAVLYRTNAQSRAFEEEMRKQGIPYRIYGGLSFYQRKEIKDIIAYFRLVVNPSDEEAIKRIINYPTRGIGNTTVDKIAATANTHNISFWEIISNPVNYRLDVNKGTMTKLAAFRDLLVPFMEQLVKSDAYELGTEIIKKSGIAADLYSSSDPEAVSRQENLQELLSSLQMFVESRKEEGREREIYLMDFLQEVSLLTDLDSEGDDASRVSLMTVHSAKGLEFPTVFVVGMEENIFPSQLSLTSLRELEEERRLLYVAITRAEKHCILTYAKNRWRYGKMEFGTPSRFLKDIDPQLMSSDSSGESAVDSYSGKRKWESDSPYFNSRMQNSRPVASQFRADPKPKITSSRHQEEAVDPFSGSFKQQLSSLGTNMKKVSDVMSKGGRVAPSSSLSDISALAEGNVIEHQRFGVGKVIKIEGAGESMKATVAFQNMGTKQLLLKFAKFEIIG